MHKAFIPNLPKLMTDRDKDLFAQFKTNLEIKEPMVFSGVAGSGRDYLFTAIMTYLQKNTPSGYDLVAINTLSHDELKEFGNHLKENTRPSIVCINIFTQQDESDFATLLSELRKQRGYNFVFYYFTSIQEIFNSLQQLEFSTSRYLHVLSLLDFTDTQHVIHEHAQKFGKTFSEKEEKEIYTVSCGHPGLIKTLTLLKCKNPHFTFFPENLMKEQAIMYKLQRIYNDLPKNIKENEKQMLEKFQVLQNNILFNPLLTMITPSQSEHIIPQLSPAEKRVYEYLQSHKNLLITKEDLAKVIWGEDDLEDKYSEWAISQLIYRLKQKIKNGETLTAEKGKGYWFNYSL